MVSHVESWAMDSVLSHSHPHCPPVFNYQPGIMKLLNPCNSHLPDRTLQAVFKMIVFCMQHLWRSKYPFPQLSSPNRLYPSSQRREIQRPRSALFTSQGYLHWKCQDLGTSVGTAHAAVTNPRAPLALTVLQPESSQGAESSAQVRKRLMFFQHSEDNQLCTSRAMRVRIEGPVTQLCSGNTTGTSGEQKELPDTHTSCGRGC